MAAGKRVRVGINLMRAQEMAGGKFSGVLDLARLCDRMGVDEVHISDHVVMSRSGFDSKPHFPYALDFDGWYEPIATLSAIAAVTKTLRLSTNIMIAPLRPVILLAKQVATLDVISDGRADMVFGVGWQKEEFDSSNIPFDGRYSLMEEQVHACRALWAGGGATYHGEKISFQDFHSFPLPVQGARVPVSFGLPTTDRNLGRIARAADGWFPAPMGPAELAENVARVKGAFAAVGRDPASALIRAPLALNPPASMSMDEVFAEAPGLIEVGADIIVAHPLTACRTAADWEEFVRRLVALKG